MSLVVSLISSFHTEYGRRPDRITMHRADADALLMELEATARFELPDPSGWCPADEMPAIRDDGFFAWILGVPAYVGHAQEGEPRAEMHQ